jgi:hypothetical protein
MKGMVIAGGLGIYQKRGSYRFHVFVANRVQMLRDRTDPDQWFYVNSENNPADHASRGMSAFGIAYSTWNPEVCLHSALPTQLGLRNPSFLWTSDTEIKDIDTFRRHRLNNNASFEDLDLHYN